MWQLDGPVELLDSDETLTVVRQGRSPDVDVTYIDGLPVGVHAPSAVQIPCTWQPMGGKDLLLLPEAFRERENVWLWQEHYSPDGTTFKVTVGDVVLRNGRAYQVQSDEDWESYTRSHLCGIDVGPYQGLVDATNPPPIYPVNTDITIIEPDPTPTGTTTGTGTTGTGTTGTDTTGTDTTGTDTTGTDTTGTDTTGTDTTGTDTTGTGTTGTGTTTGTDTTGTDTTGTDTTGTDTTGTGTTGTGTTTGTGSTG